MPPDAQAPPAETIAGLKRRIAVAEEESAALRGPGQEESYMRACSEVDALELQLEAHLRQAVT